MTTALYAAVLGAAFVVGLAVLAALCIYLLDRAGRRRRRPSPRPRDPYTDAQALAARRRLATTYTGASPGTRAHAARTGALMATVTAPRPAAGALVRLPAWVTDRPYYIETVTDSLIPGWLRLSGRLVLGELGDRPLSCHVPGNQVRSDVARRGGDESWSR